MRQLRLKHYVGTLSFLIINCCTTPAYAVQDFDSVLVSNWLKVGGSAAANNSAALELNSTTKGLLIPRMTTVQRDAISSPATGLMIFNTTLGRYDYYTGSVWTGVGSGDVVGPASATDNGFVRFDGTTGKLLKDSAATLVNADISSSAAIAVSKLAALTINRAVGTDGGGALTPLNTTSTQVNYLSTTTGDVQVALDGKVAKSTYSAKGSILSATAASTPADVPVGANGTVLVADSTVSAGVKWGTSAGGGTNNTREYITNGKAEIDTTGWSMYADAAATTPVDGTGGSPATTIARTTTGSEILRETASFKMAKSAANRQGEGFSYDFVADPQAYKNGAAIYVSFDYKTTANYASSDIICSVYDKDAASLLTLRDANSLNGALPASTNGTKFTGFFYPTTSTSDDYRFICHIATTNATAYDFIFDSVHIGTSTLVPGAIVSDLGTEAWADNQANSTTSVKLTRIGNRVFADGVVSYTGAQSGGFTLTIPTAYTPDPTLYPISSNIQYTVGSDVDLIDVGTGVTKGLILITAANTLSIFSGSYSNLSSTSPHTWANTDRIEFRANWIVSGWSTGAALSTSEAMVSTAKFTANKNANQTISSASPTKVTWPGTPTKDSLGWWDSTNNRYVVKKPGRYQVSTGLGFQNISSELCVVSIYVNGAAVQSTAYNPTSTFTPGPALALDLSVNDYVEIFVDSTADTSYDILGSSVYTWFTITEQPDFSVFSTYGTFEIITATSSIKTPGASGDFLSMTGNSVSLTPGTWKLQGSVNYKNSGSSPAYTNVTAGWFGANGADSGSTPAALTTLTGLTVLSAGDSTEYRSDSGTLSSSSNVRMFNAPTLVIRVTQVTSIYLVGAASLTTAGNARVTAYATAERLQ